MLLSCAFEKLVIATLINPKRKVEQVVSVCVYNIYIYINIMAVVYGSSIGAFGTQEARVAIC